MKNLLIAALLSMACLPVHAKPTGNDIYQLCANQLYGELACLAYVSGFIAGMNGQANKTQSKPLFCYPENASYEQITDVFKKYLSDNPKSRNLESADLLVKAMSNWTPCNDD